MIPHLREVERVVRHFRRLLFRHDLHEQLPLREIALFDGVKQVALVALPVFGDDGLCLRVGQVFDSLLAHKVEFHPVAPVFRVDEAERVAAEPVHVAVRRRDTAVAHRDGDLMERFRQGCPEIPVVFRAAQVRFWIPFDRVVEVRELERVAQEEHRRVVPDKIPVALLGVELHREAADVPLGIGRAALTGHRGKPHEAVGLLADFREYLGLCVFGDVVRDGERAERARSLRVHTPLRDHFPVEMSQLFEEPDVLQQSGSPRACRHQVLVVNDGCPHHRGEFLFPGHGLPSLVGAIGDEA